MSSLLKVDEVTELRKIPVSKQDLLLQPVIHGWPMRRDIQLEVGNWGGSKVCAGSEYKPRSEGGLRPFAPARTVPN